MPAAAFGKLREVSLTLMLLVPAVAHATTPESDGQGGVPVVQTPAKPEPAPLVPAPPLFPKHRRGLYRDGKGFWVLDSTPQSPPLDVDDPGVPERGEYEINLSSRVDFSRPVRTFDLLFVDANYGLLPRVRGHELPMQLKFEVPVEGAKDSGQPLTTGLGAAKIGVKINFYNSEHKGTELSFYPQIEFALGSGEFVDPGQTLVFPLLLSKKLPYATAVVNVAVNTPLHDPDRHTTGTYGAGLGLDITRHVAVMAELGGESRFDFAHDRVLSVAAGLMRSIGHSSVLYTNVGRTLFSDDLPHTYAGVGVKVLIDGP